MLFPLKRVLAYDVAPEVAERFAHEARERWSLDVTVVKEPRQAVAESDLVVTAGPILRTPHATIQPGWLQEGAFASLVDFDSYWSGAALQQADKFCTDDIPQLEHYRHIGYFQEIPPIYAGLGELVTGAKPGRETRASARWPATWVWRWMTWRPPPSSIGERSNEESAPGCHCSADAGEPWTVWVHHKGASD